MSGALVPFYIPRRRPDGSRWWERLSDCETRRRIREEDERLEELKREAMAHFHDEQDALALGLIVGDRESVERVMRPPWNGSIGLRIRDARDGFLGLIIRPNPPDNVLEFYAHEVVRENGRQGVKTGAIGGDDGVEAGTLLKGASWKNRRGATVRKHIREKLGVEYSPSDARPEPKRRVGRSTSWQHDSEEHVRRRDPERRRRQPSPAVAPDTLPPVERERALEVLRLVRKRVRGVEQRAILDEQIARIVRDEPCTVRDVARALIGDPDRRRTIVQNIERAAQNLLGDGTEP
jgi:hypothetical protein